MKLYNNDLSSASARVRIALALKGLQAEYLPVTVLGPAADNRTPAYLEVNPQGLVPALVTDEGALLTQSLAIVEYLDELQPQPPLLPAGREARAWVRAFALAIAADIHPLAPPRVAAYIETLPGADQATIATWRRHWLEEGMDALDALLARSPSSGPFCLGDAPTLADIFLFPQAVNVERAGLSLERWPRVAAVVEHLRTVPAFVDHGPAPLR